MNNIELMNIVIVGHVDHGKSTVVGRLLADTHSLPEGKLEAVKARCERESKVFEYAFLLDALKDEQSQGITIDSARCFFKSKKRDYIIIDAPGHIEFLKNMISGAARAEAALLVIDAKEGVKENSRRHGYLLSMLGVKQVVVAVNKMDLVGYDKAVFERIKEEYSKFLGEIKVTAREFIPVSGLLGDNIVSGSVNIPWFKGNSILAALDNFEKEKEVSDQALRMPVQDVYKFTKGDDRRLVAGRIEAGTVNVGDDVVFMPSNKKSRIKSIEEFNKSGITKAVAGQSIAVTLEEQIYINRGDVMCSSKGLPYISSLFKAKIFWMGKSPLEKDKEYKLKIGTAKTMMHLSEIVNVLNASNLITEQKNAVERHEVAECVLRLSGPVAFDISGGAMGRFVIVDDYDIAGGGIISEYLEDKQAFVREQVYLREEKWYSSGISLKERMTNYGQVPKLILITGPSVIDKKDIARKLERKLFEQGRKVYSLIIGNLLRGLDADIDKAEREEHIRRLGEVGHLMIDAGLIVIATASDLTSDELLLLQTITSKDMMIIVNVGKNQLSDELIDLRLEHDSKDNVDKILELLKIKNVMFGV
ncbi:MAG: GTP-binding protein [Nanoarchaeota archaeon]|nr:GTP-binding protein [Nanoarchaeota archaeon]MBU1704993.1 GTP-binding protein [Nanoarchaeota archaeon]